MGRSSRIGRAAMASRISASVLSADRVAGGEGAGRIEFGRECGSTPQAKGMGRAPCWFDSAGNHAAPAIGIEA